MPAVEVIDGAVVRLWIRLAAEALDRARPAIDVLNVFPVADSDTGTNLHRTIANAADALERLPAPASTADIWHEAATAALRGACGNSGIIVSQFLCGLADTCAPATACDGRVFALALARAAELARAAVHRPVEGTVLTVADAAAEAAAAAAAQSVALSEVGRAAAAGARQALMATRQQLDVLAASGVVDAGGAGLCVLLDALNAAISGTQPGDFAVPEPAPERAAAAWPIASAFCYEVTFLLDAAQEAVGALRERLDVLGDSLVVSGREQQWHVHVHVADAGAVIEAALAVGQPEKITITYLNQTQGDTPAGQPVPSSRIVAVVEGAGLAGLLRAAGATAVELQPGIDLSVVLDEFVTSGRPAALIAPAGQVTRPWPAGWAVLEVESMIQSLAALAVHDPRRAQDADLAAMRKAVAGMRWASLSWDQDPTGAGRAETGLLVGHVAGQVAACGPDQAALAITLCERLLAADPELITLVTGRDAGPELGSVVARHLEARAPAVEVVCYDGGMTSVVLLIGAE